MKKELSVVAVEDDLTVGLVFPEVPASRFTGFAERIAEPFYRGDMAIAVEDLMQRAIAEGEFVLSHIKYVKSEGNG
jgi:hypothetical protein